MSQIFQWVQKPNPDKAVVQKLISEINVSSPIATILAQRGITNYNEAKSFFNPSINDIHDPFLMKNMHKAVDLIENTLRNNQNILIYGDYDVDGTTAVSLMYLYLKNFTSQISYYLPDRYAEGYGISEKGIQFAIDNNISLIISLDCGIKANETIAFAKENNIQFIVCDHHTPGEILPPADAILNPKQADCNYPYKELSGCGVGFKLIQAFNQKQGNLITEVLPYLDLVVVSIAADIVPITGENRVLAHFGLEILNNNPRTGLAILLETVNHPIDISKIVFGIAPKINAAGRVKHANHSIDLLTCKAHEKAKEFLTEINQLNGTRRDFDAQTTEEALNQIKQNNEENDYSTVVYKENWHLGVVGIVASRLISNYYRPTLVFTKNGEMLTASARSTSNFDLYEALQNFEHLFIKFGGHKFAAGLSLSEENYPVFKKQFELYAKNNIPETDRLPSLEIDCELDLSQLSSSFFTVLNRLSPFGPQNLNPVFLSSKVSLTDCNFIGLERNHLRCKVKPQNSNALFQAIYFNCLDKIDIESKNEWDIVYSIEENHWQNTKTLQLIIKDIR